MGYPGARPAVSERGFRADYHVVHRNTFCSQGACHVRCRLQRGPIITGTSFSAQIAGKSGGLRQPGKAVWEIPPWWCVKTRGDSAHNAFRARHQEFSSGGFGTTSAFFATPGVVILVLIVFSGLQHPDAQLGFRPSPPVGEER